MADDSPLNRRVALLLLEAAGHRVTLVANGRLAVEALERRDFDVVLMDVEMPEMDGLAATRAIRRREKTAGGHVPIVAVTAHENPQECLSAGMDAFLPKDELAKQLNMTLGRILGDAAA